MAHGEIVVRCPIDNKTCHRETESHCPTKDENGISLCTLGTTSIPVPQGNAFVVYELKETNAEGMMRITLSQTHKKFVRLVAERGGEIDFDFAKTEEHMREPLRKHLADLVTMGVMESADVIGHSSITHYHLTTMGRNLASSIIKQGA